jgi:fumarate reductase subunit D
MRLSRALAVSLLCFCWNSVTQFVTLVTISVAVFRAASRAARALPGFRLLRSARFTTLTTFFSDIVLISVNRLFLILD